MKVNSDTGEIELEPDFSKKYLTFEAIESGTFKFSGATSAHTLSYSLDGGTTWTTLAHNTNTPTIAAGSKIMWKGNLTPNTFGIGNFVATGKFNAYGNTMSLLYGDNFIGQTDLTGKDNAFTNLFKNNINLVNTQNLILPATTLANCCYVYMFQGCTGLATAPELPATTLAFFCYRGMFSSCTNLNYLKAMFISDNGDIESYTDSWVSGVAASGTFVKNSAATWSETGSDGIPRGWTVETADA